MAQGNLVVGGAGASGGGSKVAINHLSAGRIAGGATVEREVPTPVGQGEFVHFELNDTDFGTAQRVVEAINRGRRRAPPAPSMAARCACARRSMPTSASPSSAASGTSKSRRTQMAAKVIVNCRTGSVVMNQTVTLDNCAVAHGNLSVSVTAENAVSQPGALSGGQTAAVTNAQIDIKQEGGGLFNVHGGANLADVVKALNAIGANPQDLIAILQAMKSAGALRAELEII